MSPNKGPVRLEQSASTLTEMPVELLIAIGKYLPNSDLTQLRLCCRSLADIGLRCLSIDVRSFLHSDSERQLQDLLTCQAICLRVKQFRIDVDGYQNAKTIIVDSARGHILPEHLPILDEFKYQEYTLATKTHHFLWQSVLRQCKDIDCLTLVHQRAFRQKTYGGKFKNPYLPHHNDWYGPVVSNSAEELLALLEILGKTAVRLRKLRAGLVRLDYFSSINTERLESLTPSLRRLTSLELRVCTDVDDRVINGGLRRTIASLHSLQSVSIAGRWSDVVMCGATFDDIFDVNHVWNHLRKIELVEIKLYQDSFLQFCARHRGILKALEMDSFLLEGRMQPFLERLQKTTSLEEACITGDVYTLKLNAQTRKLEMDAHWEFDWYPLGENGKSFVEDVSDYLVHGGPSPFKGESVNENNN